MIARAGRVIPGMLATMLVATPALAALPQDGPIPGEAPASRNGNDPAASGIPHFTYHPRTAIVSQRKSPFRQASAPLRRRTVASSVSLPVQNAAFVDDGFTRGAPGDWRQSGIASWYGGKRWQGNRTSSGDRYDENALTAAHATLPLGSRVLVTIPDSGRSVIVTINDRPGTRTRIIDLSRAAAEALGIISRGVARVTLSRL